MRVSASAPAPLLTSAAPDTSPPSPSCSPLPTCTVPPPAPSTTARAVSNDTVGFNTPPSSVNPPAPSTASAPTCSVPPLTTVLPWLLAVLVSTRVLLAPALVRLPAPDSAAPRLVVPLPVSASVSAVGISSPPVTSSVPVVMVPPAWWMPVPPLFVSATRPPVLVRSAVSSTRPVVVELVVTLAGAGLV